MSTFKVVDLHWKPLKLTNLIGNNGEIKAPTGDKLINLLVKQGYDGLSNLTSDIMIAKQISTALKYNPRRFKSCEIFTVLNLMLDSYQAINSTNISSTCKDNLMEARDLLNEIGETKHSSKNTKFRMILSQTFDIGESYVVDHLKSWNFQLLSLYFKHIRKHDREYEYFIGSLKMRLRHYLYRDKMEIAFKLLERAFLDLYEHDNRTVIRTLKLLRQDQYMIETASSILLEEINKKSSQYIMCKKYFHLAYVHYIGRLFDLSAYYIAWKEKHGVRPPYIIPNFYAKLDTYAYEKDFTLPDTPLEVDYKIRELHEHLVCIKDDIENTGSLEIDTQINTLNYTITILQFATEVFPFLKD